MTATAPTTARPAVAGPADDQPGPYAAFAVATVDPDAPDFEKIRVIANDIVPFRRYVGVEITEVGAERSVVEIPDRPEMTNHMGTVHAGALFLAADLAGAAALVGALTPRLAQLEYVLVRDAHSAFRKPARGRIRAVGLVDEREAGRVRAGRGRERFDLDVKALLYDDADVLVARFRFDYACSVAVAVAVAVADAVADADRARAAGDADQARPGGGE